MSYMKSNDFAAPNVGEIYWAQLDFNGNSNIQGGTRPVLVVSNVMNNKHSPCVNVIPITSAEKKLLLCHVVIDRYWYCGLEKPSTILVEQITTIDAWRLRGRIGRLNEYMMRKVCNAFKVQFPIFDIE